MRKGVVLTALIAAALSGEATAAGSTRCDRLRALFSEGLRSDPASGTCSQAQATHDRYYRYYPMVLEECRKLEVRAEAGPARLRQGTEEEMTSEAMEVRQRDISEHQARLAKVSHELLRTPIDADDPANPPESVDDACGSAIERYVALRRRALTALAELYAKIEQTHDGLLVQAQERGTRQPAAAVPRKPGR